MCGGFAGDVFDAGKDLVGDVADTLGDAGTDIWQNGGKEFAAYAIGFTVGGLFVGLATAFYSDELYYTLSGEKDRDERKLNDMGESLNRLSGEMNKLQDSLGNKVFLEQIFKYGDIRRIKDIGTSYEELRKEYESLLDDYKNNTDVEFIGGLVLFVPNVASALVYNILDYIKTGDSASLRTAISISLLIVVIVVSILALVPSGGSSSVPLSVAISASLAILSAVLTLDAMVNNSGLLGSAFQIIDLVLNKILNADKYFHTEGFDKDSQYYDEMMNNTRLVVQIAAISASLYTIYTTPATATATTTTTTTTTTTIQTESGLAAMSSKYTSFMKDIGSYSVSGVSLSDMYNAYTLANQANDVYAATQLHKELQDKLSDAKDEMQKQINKDNRRKMQSSYSDAEYIMNQVDMSYHSYVLAMSEAGQSDVFDPEGTIVMNTRYSPKKAVMFGFEDMFQYEGMAGGELYVYNTLWK